MEIAAGFVQQSIWPDGVGQVEEFGVEATAINLKRFFVERFSLRVPRFDEVHVRDVADSVGVSEAIVFSVVDLRSFGIVSASHIEVASGAGLFALSDRFFGGGHT
jgi:hypothetical protein